MNICLNKYFQMYFQINIIKFSKLININLETYTTISVKFDYIFENIFKLISYFSKLISAFRTCGFHHYIPDTESTYFKFDGKVAIISKLVGMIRLSLEL